MHWAGAGMALALSTILAVSWPSSYPDGIYALGLGRRTPYALPVYIWIYCVIWWFIQVCGSKVCLHMYLSFYLYYLVFMLIHIVHRMQQR